jgi:hypothetical protein
MDQFRVHMYFLQIKQLLTFIYTLKIYFYFIFFGFRVFWTRHQIPQRTGASSQKPHRLSFPPKWTTGSNL